MATASPRCRGLAGAVRMTLAQSSGLVRHRIRVHDPELGGAVGEREADVEMTNS